MQNRVREIRRAKGMKQIELAKKSGVARQTLSYIEACDEHYPSTKTMGRIAKALGCSFDELYRPMERR